MNVVFVHGLSFGGHVRGHAFRNFVLIGGRFFLGFRSIYLPFLFLFLQRLVQRFHYQYSFLHKVDGHSRAIGFRVVSGLRRFFILLFYLPQRSTGRENSRDSVQSAFSRVVSSLSRFFFVYFSSRTLRGYVITILSQRIRVIASLFVLGRKVSRFLVSFLQVAMRGAGPRRAKGPIRTIWRFVRTFFPVRVRAMGHYLLHGGSRFLCTSYGRFFY